MDEDDADVMTSNPTVYSNSNSHSNRINPHRGGMHDREGPVSSQRTGEGTV